MLLFSNKTVLVTGSARNTGYEIAKAFLKEGATVFVNGRNEEKSHKAVEMLLSCKDINGKAIAAPCDMGNPDSIYKLFEKIRDKGCALDVLVNNAVLRGVVEPFLSTEFNIVNEVFRVNFFGVFLCSQEAAKIMCKHGGGSIVNISSNVSARAIRNCSAYVSSKGAIDALTRSMSIELGEHNIRVNTIAPGYIYTNRWDELDKETVQRRRSNVPLGKEATQLDIAKAVLFMASNQANNITGARLVIDGGCSAQHMPSDMDV